MRNLLLGSLILLSGCTDPTMGLTTPPDMSAVPDLTLVFAMGCMNGSQDGDETDIDCGGSCPACDANKGCAVAKDCKSGVCINKHCAAPACNDGIKNGDESDVDCGGSCPNKCAEGQKCGDGPDCQSGTCANNVCTLSLCSNNKQDGKETDVDCGGPVCMKCGDGKKCGDGTDCLGGMCVNNVCKSPASCNDGVKNGSETDVDCGGGTCPKCGLGKTCGKGLDCQSGKCSAGKCTSANGLTLSFGAAASLATNNTGSLTDLAAGDLNGDKNVDLVAVENSTNKVLVLLGGGNGTLQPPIFYNSLGNNPYHPAIADFNGDGKPDVLVPNISPGVVPGVLALLPGKGDGALTPGSTFASGGGAPIFVVGADWNNDGKIDFAVINTGQNAENLSVFIATGNGAFAQPVPYSLNGNPQAAAVADFDGDKRLDFAVTNFTGNVLTFLLGRGDGTFTAGTNSVVGIGGQAVVAGDFNGDGHPDLAAAMNPNVNTHSITVLMNDGKGNFGNPTPINLADATPYPGLAAADFNLDGFVDLAVIDFAANQVLVFQSKGDGTFQNPLLVPAGKNPIGVVTADMNNDGKPDICFTMPQSAGIILNTSK